MTLCARCLLPHDNSTMITKHDVVFAGNRPHEMTTNLDGENSGVN